MLTVVVPSVCGACLRVQFVCMATLSGQSRSLSTGRPRLGYGAWQERKEGARDKFGVQQGSVMTSVSLGTKGHNHPEPGYLFLRSESRTVVKGRAVSGDGNGGYGGPVNRTKSPGRDKDKLEMGAIGSLQFPQMPVSLAVLSHPMSS